VDKKFFIYKKRDLTAKNAKYTAVGEKERIIKIYYLIILLILPSFIYPQQEKEDEIQVNFNSYFDNFRLNVIYPSINVTKNIDDNTSVTGSYLVDAISSASMKMIFKVDGVTSATLNKQGGADNTPDELRHQVNFGVTRNFSAVTVSADGMYSTEHDYSSKTIATNVSIPFAKKNTNVQIGFAGNRDKIFPQTRFWTKDRNTITLNLGLTQILSKSIVSQFDFSFINIDGYMLDGYQVVRIIDGFSVKILEPILPEKRIRKALGVRTNFGISKHSAILLGYRYYWDTWDIRSHTLDAEYKTHLNDNLNLIIGYRQYYQTKAYFFKETYSRPEPLMGVDSKLNSGFTNDASVSLSFKGNKKYHIPILNNDKITLMGSAGFFHRHTDSPDWVMRLRDLYAYLISLGFKISI
jgi:hypothetical protein